MTGATFKALADPTNNSDFILMQLKQAVPQSYNPYFNGWSRSEVPSTSGACIHHPSGDVKKINTYSTSLISAPYYQGNPPTHWIVYWATGAVEGGSSGSPIFNSSGKLIGTLTGGTSSCDNPNNPDGFGKFSYHWNHLTSSQNRLREWLDPDNVDFTEINGSFQPCSSNMNINANFKANETNIAPGTTVNFTDYSIGHPTSWAWTFTGGSPASSTAKNPSVTYNNPGIYPVTLKASNTSSSNIMSKSAYITVNSGVCKKINYPINGNIGVLSLKLQDGTFWGYVSGNNKGDDKIKANIFNFDSGHPYILGAYFLFGIAKNATNPNITFGLWSKGINGKPALLMATGSLPMAAIADDVANKRETYVQFNYPQKVTSSYFIGVYLPSKSGDTLAIKSNKDGDTNPGIAWEQWVDDSWHAYSEKGCWDIDIANAIYPFACDEYTGINNPNLRHNLLNINIFPNPAYDAINISFGKNIRIKAEITLFNPEGICVIKQNLNKLTSDYRMNIKDLAAGLYYLNINCSEGNITRKISVMNR
jgi:PKD repeat protein